MERMEIKIIVFYIFLKSHFYKIKMRIFLINKEIDQIHVYIFTVQGTIYFTGCKYWCRLTKSYPDYYYSSDFDNFLNFGVLVGMK